MSQVGTKWVGLTSRCMVCASTHNRPIFKMGQISLASTQGGSTQLTRTDTEVEWESSHPAKWITCYPWCTSAEVKWELSRFRLWLRQTMSSRSSTPLCSPALEIQIVQTKHHHAISGILKFHQSYSHRQILMFDNKKKWLTQSNEHSLSCFIEQLIKR